MEYIFLANKGASVPTIMKMLGHQSPDMTIVYSTIFDETVKEEYQKTIDNSEISGGLYAKSLKNNELNKEEVDWIKANFHKTYLITGHCFHHTREPMCDFADACFFCSKYVTTKEYIPILQEKYKVEDELIKDAENRNWEKEIIRHKRVAERVKEILIELGGCIIANNNPIQKGLVDYRNKKKLDTQKKILKAFDALKRSNSKVSISAIAKKAGVSTVTIYKYPEIADKIKGYRDGEITKHIKKRKNITINQLEIINQGLELKIEELKKKTKN